MKSTTCHGSVRYEYDPIPKKYASNIPKKLVGGRDIEVDAGWRSWMQGLRLTHKQQERHSYEKCQYDEFKKRVAKMDELRAEKDGKRSN